jgi:hypothetical protein
MWDALLSEWNSGADIGGHNLGDAQSVETLKWMKSVERGRSGCKTALYLLCATHSLAIQAWLSAAQPASHDL